MKPIIHFLASVVTSIGGLIGPSIQGKAASDMAKISGNPIKPLVRGQSLSISATATFKVAGYYQFYAYMEDSEGTTFWNCGSLISQKRAVGDTATVSGTFGSSLQKTTQKLIFMLYCTTGDYSGYQQKKTATLDLVEPRQFVDLNDNAICLLGGRYHYWNGGSLKIALESVRIPALNRDAVDPGKNHIEILGPNKTFTYSNAATSNVYDGTPSAEFWLLSHFDDFVGGTYNAGWTPKRRLFYLTINQAGSGLFYFSCEKTFIYDRRTLQMQKNGAEAGKTFSSNLVFIPIGLGRHAPEEEPYRWRLILRNFSAGGHYFEFNGSFKRTKEDMGYAGGSRYYIHVS